LVRPSALGRSSASFERGGFGELVEALALVVEGGAGEAAFVLVAAL
jgi:hypothetical protein